MGIFLVTAKKKNCFSSNIHVLYSKKTLGFCRFMNQGPEIINFNKLAHIEVTENINTAVLLKCI